MKDFKLLAFDTETIGLGGDAIFVSWCDGVDPHGRKLTRRHTLTDWLLEVVLNERYDRHFIVAHNGLRFDFARIDWLRLVQSGFEGRIFTAKNINTVRGFDLKKGRLLWRFRDSITFCPLSLDEFSKLFAPDFRKKTLDFSKTNFDPDNKQHVAYALRDAEALFHSCQAYDDFLREDFNVTMMDAVTLSGVGMKAVRTISKEQEYEAFPALDTRLEQVVRSSYHGGFVCAFRVGNFRDCLYYDVNSAYAYIMKKYPMPAGAPVVAASEKYHDLLSLKLATVDFKNSYPYLISRPDGLAGRFKGVVTGWFWDFELELQESLGAEIKVWKQIVWPDSDNRLFHFVGKCESVRHRDYNGPMGQLAKLLQNSVYGKFGAAKHQEDIVLSLKCPDDRAFPILDDEGNFIEGLWSIPSNENRIKLTMVHWASYITARTRWLLMSFLLKVPQDQWIYCDTDSFIVESKAEKIFQKFIGKSYGDIKLECVFKTLNVMAPKVYIGYDGDGKSKVAAKGIPRRHREQAFKDRRAEFESTRSFMFNLKGKLKRNHPGVYSRSLTRELSGAHSIQCGSYENGIWTPEFAQQALELVPGLTPELNSVIGRYSEGLCPQPAN